MFLSSEKYLEQFFNLIKESDDLSVAVAFWGDGAQALIANAWRGQSLRLVCNLSTGGTNPKVIRDLLKLAEERPGIKILKLDNLHAKVAVSSSAAIVGSANLSVNGLGSESSECAGWHEAGILVGEQKQLASIQEWFEKVWSQAQGISEKDLQKAEVQWARNRMGRSLISGKFSNAPSVALKNRNIYIAIYQQEASSEAIAEAEKIEKDASSSVDFHSKNSKLDFFEDWCDDCEEPLPKDSPIISMRYEKRRLSAIGAWIRVPQLDKTFKDKDGKDVPLTMLGQLKHISGLTLSQAEGRILARRLKPWVDELYANAELGTSRCLPLDEFLSWESEKAV